MLEDRRERALTLLRLLVGLSKPNDWEPYDEWGDPVNVDVSNTGDWHFHGVDVGQWNAAKIVRRALRLLETSDCDEETNDPPEDWDEDETTTLGLGA